MNGKDIYESCENTPLMITVPETGYSFFVTNGFHTSHVKASKKVQLLTVYSVGAAIDNIQLLTGFVLSALFFLIFILTHLQLFLAMANIPVFIMVYMLFIRKKDFLQVHRLKTPDKLS